jgi:hypothetical protein
MHKKENILPNPAEAGTKVNRKDHKRNNED